MQIEKGKRTSAVLRKQTGLGKRADYIVQKNDYWGNFDREYTVRAAGRAYEIEQRRIEKSGKNRYH